MLVDMNKLQLECARSCRSLRAVLKTAHIANGTVTRIKAGKEVRPVIVGKLAEALNVDVTQILKD